jgi:hypothetical protein
MSGDIYPRIDRWLVPVNVWAATLAGVLDAGRRGCESGAFWLGTRCSLAEIQAVILPSGAGVEEHPYQWRVSPEVFGEISSWAKPRGLSLLGIAHTHMVGVPVDLSMANRLWSVQVPGVLSVVIGDGGMENEFTRWGWFVYEKNDYRRMPLVELLSRVQLRTEGTLGVYRADSFGIWPQIQE